MDLEHLPAGGDQAVDRLHLEIISSATRNFWRCSTPKPGAGAASETLDKVKSMHSPFCRDDPHVVRRGVESGDFQVSVDRCSSTSRSQPSASSTLQQRD